MRPYASHVLRTMLRISTNLVLDIHIIYCYFLQAAQDLVNRTCRVFILTGSHAKQCVKSSTLTFSTSIYACMFMHIYAIVWMECSLPDNNMSTRF